MLTYFGGPVFTDDSALSLLGIFTIAALPIVLSIAGMALIIRDIIQKRRRKSTIIFLGIAAFVIFLVQFVFSSAI